MLVVEDQIIALELLQTVEMVITETVPVLKAASASARTKPAHFATGLDVWSPSIWNRVRRYAFIPAKSASWDVPLTRKITVSVYIA